MAEANDIRKALESQISELRGEVASLSRSLSRQGGDAYSGMRDRAGHLYEDASKGASRAVRRVDRQARAVGDAARENPGTAATLITTVGVLAFVLGFLAGHGSDERRR